MMTTLKIRMLVLFLFGIALHSKAQTLPEYKSLNATDSITPEGKRVYTTQRFTSEVPKIDGHLNDACWLEGNWSGSYLQHLPNEGEQPSQQTKLKVLYDDKNMYIAIRCYDNEPEKIDRQLGRRDDFMGDVVGINFDSYYDKRTGFEFNLSAGGAQIDLMLQNDGWDTSWDAVWEGKTSLEDSAWTAEYRIPLSQLRYSADEIQKWGMHAWRWINRNQEEDNWNLIPRDNPGLMRSIGELVGIENLPKSRRIEILPYTLGKAKFYEKEAGNPYAKGTDIDFNYGLDAKIGITSDFTLDLAMFPDFGQVEADPAVLNLSAFETFFDEKRPFFLEGKNITDFNFGGGSLFYSRRIGQGPSYSPDLDSAEYAESVQNTAILGAAKVTGKTKNGLSVGIINAITAKETIEKITPTDTSNIAVEPFSNYFVSRLQQDINSGNTIIGGMITNTRRAVKDSHLEFLTDQATTGGIDFRHHWKEKTYFFDAKTVFSQVQGAQAAITDLQYSSARYYQRPDADHLEIDSSLTQLSGYGGEFAIGKSSGGKWRYNAYVGFRSPGLDLNEIGFLPTADQINQSISVDYVVNEPNGNVREYAVSSSQNNNFNFAGEYLQSSLHFSGRIKFENKWNYWANYNRFFNEINTKILRGGPSIYSQGFHCASAGFGSNDSKRVSFGFNYHTHIFDSKLSSETSVSPNITWRATKSLRLSANTNYSVETNGFQYVDDDYGSEYFMASLKRKTMGMTLRADYAITPEITLQYYGNPYISVGEYSKYKIISDYTSKEYDKLYHQYTDGEKVYDEDANEYALTHNGNSYDIANPDFNFQQFHSNFVARWEYKTGSTLYFVWSHVRNQYSEVTNMSLNDNIDDLIGTRPQNTFLIKFNYWFSL
jgi:hypothetical protein